MIDAVCIFRISFFLDDTYKETLYTYIYIGMYLFLSRDISSIPISFSSFLVIQFPLSCMPNFLFFCTLVNFVLLLLKG